MPKLKRENVKNSQQLMNLVARAERGALLPGEAEILRDAIKLLDDMATTLDKLFGRHPGDYETTSTQSMRVIGVGYVPHSRNSNGGRE